MYGRQRQLAVLVAVVAVVACKNPITDPNGSSAAAVVSCTVAGRTDVLLTDPVTIAFSASMDETVTQGAVSLLPAQSGAYEWSENSTVLTFRPDFGFQPDTLYSLLVAKRARDRSGNTLADAYSASFRTLALLQTPQNVVATVGPGYVDVNWAEVPGADGYTVYWSKVMGAGTSGTAVETTSEWHRHAGVVQGEEYFFVVRARRGTDLGPVSVEVGSSVRVLAAPGGLEVMSADRALILNWADVPLATAYSVYWSTTPGSGKSGTRIAGATSPFTHEGLLFGWQYYYTVTAENAAGEGLLSAEVSGIPLGTFDAPLGVSARAGLASVVVEWEPVEGATQYNVYWSQTPDPASGIRIPDVSSPFTHSGRTNGEPYYYAVAAANAHFDGDLSAMVTATAGHVLVADVPFVDANLAAAVINTGKTYVHEVANLTTGAGITDLSGLEYLWALTGFHSGYTTNSYQTLAPLSGISTIQSLTLGSSNLTDIAAVATMPNLHGFSVYHGPALTDLAALGSCQQLGWIYLSYTNASDLSFLSGLQQLGELSVWSSPVTDSSYFQGLPDLHWLTLGDLPMTDLSSIQNLPSLYGLEIYGLSIWDLGFLSGLPDLYYLYMNYCGLSDVSDLGSLTGLLALWLDDNQVADVSPLSSLTGLSELSLAYNLVTNVSPLSSLDQLEFLGLAYNEITTGVTTLVTLTSAWQIDFSGNYEIPEADLDVLEGALGPGVVLRP